MLGRRGVPEGWGTILYLFISLSEPSPFIKTASGCRCNQTFIRQARYIKKKKTNNAQTHHTHTYSHYTAIINLRNETSPLLQARKAGCAPPQEAPEAVGTPLETVAPSLAVHPSLSFLLRSCDPRIWHLRVTGTCGAVCSPASGPDPRGSFLALSLPASTSLPTGLRCAQSSPLHVFAHRDPRLRAWP